MWPGASSDPLNASASLSEPANCLRCEPARVCESSALLTSSAICNSGTRSAEVGDGVGCAREQYAGEPMTLATLSAALDAAVDELPATELAAAIGRCASAQARLLARLTTPAAPAQPTDDVVDVASLSVELGLAPSWLRAQARAGKLPHLRCGKYIKFRRAEVLSTLARSGTDHRMGDPVTAKTRSNGVAVFPPFSTVKGA